MTGVVFLHSCASVAPKKPLVFMRCYIISAGPGKENYEHKGNTQLGKGNDAWTDANVYFLGTLLREESIPYILTHGSLPSIKTGFTPT